MTNEAKRKGTLNFSKTVTDLKHFAQNHTNFTSKIIFCINNQEDKKKHWNPCIIEVPNNYNAQI